MERLAVEIRASQGEELTETQPGQRRSQKERLIVACRIEVLALRLASSARAPVLLGGPLGCGAHLRSAPSGEGAHLLKAPEPDLARRLSQPWVVAAEADAPESVDLGGVVADRVLGHRR